MYLLLGSFTNALYIILTYIYYLLMFERNDQGDIIVINHLVIRVQKPYRFNVLILVNHLV